MRHSSKLKLASTGIFVWNFGINICQDNSGIPRRMCTRAVLRQNINHLLCSVMQEIIFYKKSTICWKNSSRSQGSFITLLCQQSMPAWNRNFWVHAIIRLQFDCSGVVIAFSDDIDNFWADFKDKRTTISELHIAQHWALYERLFYLNCSVLLICTSMVTLGHTSQYRPCKFAALLEGNIRIHLLIPWSGAQRFPCFQLLNRLRLV
jgi:hypothetical protein